MGRLLDLLRRFLVYALTYLLGFLGALAVVAAATRLESTAWMPLALGLIVLLALGLLPPFKNIVLRLALGGFFASGALSVWFISEPAAASEPTERFNILAPLIAATGPALCGIVLLLLWEERRQVSRSVWVWALGLILCGWLVSYFSANHNLDGAVLIPHPSFRYTNDFAATHSIPNRQWYQAAFYIVATVFCVGLAATSRASLASKAAFSLGVPIAFALFDEFRNTLEFTAHISKRDLALDFAVIGITGLIGLALTSSSLQRNSIERIPENSCNNQ